MSLLIAGQPEPRRKQRSLRLSRHLPAEASARQHALTLWSGQICTAQEVAAVRWRRDEEFPDDQIPRPRARLGPPPFFLPRLEEYVPNFLLHMGLLPTQMLERGFGAGFVRGLGTVHHPNVADALLSGYPPPIEYRLNIFVVREVNGWSLAVGHRGAWRVICMNAAVRRGHRLASLLTEGHRPEAQPPDVHRAHPSEIAASWPSGIYTIMY